MMERALEAFARGVGVTRSFTHPYLAERVEGLWALRDAPRTRGRYRNEEWIAHGLAPARVHCIVRAHARGRYSVTPVCGGGESLADVRAEYRALGYRLGRTEPLMVHRLQRIPRRAARAEVTRVTTPDLAAQVAKAARARQILPEHLTPDAPVRLYTALVDDAPAGWVSSIQIDTAAWCAQLYVRAEHRRRGIGAALMCRMLRDDRSCGVRLAVLAASHAGALLYAQLGYEQIGTVLLYTPPRA